MPKLLKMGPFIQKKPKVKCLLGIETSGDLCSVALSKNSSVLSHQSIHMPYGQAGHLMGLIQQVMAESEARWDQLEGVVVNRGPGSFTGLRVGLATAQGIGLAGEIPVFGLTGFQLYRALKKDTENLLVLIDTRREDCFAAFFEQHSISPLFSKVMSYEEVDAFLESRPGAETIGNFSFNKMTPYLLEAKDFFRAFWFYQNENGSSFSSDPYYLREPEVHGK